MAASLPPLVSSGDAPAAGPSHGDRLTLASTGVRPVHLGVLAAGLVAAVAVRIALLPGPGLAGDLALFTGWAAFISSEGLPRAYELPLSFPPVLPWIWAGLGVVDPGLRSAVPGDPSIDVLMKVPATLADMGLGAVVAWWLRRRGNVEAGLRPTTGWVVAAVLAILLSPVVIYDSAWWGQFESIYVLPALVATVFAARGRNDAAAALAAVALMTKPQALPLMVPLAAWFLATRGWRGVVRAAAIGAVVAAVLWLPFLASGGLGSYVADLQHYADEEYSVLSLRAWNPWWLVQLALGGRDFIADTNRILGPITFRLVGSVLAAILLLLVAIRIVRRPTPEGLVWGMASAALVGFTALTTMHERYSYPALVFLVLLWPNRLAVGAWSVLLVAVTLNVVAAVPPTGGPGSVVPLDGPIAIAGSVTVTIATVVCLAGLAAATGLASGRGPVVEQGRPERDGGVDGWGPVA